MTPECAALVKDLRLWAVEWQLTSEHVVVQAADAIERLAGERDAAEATVKLLESNARIQAKLLADTGAKLAEAVGLLRDARSNHVAGSDYDLAWDRRRDSLLVSVGRSSVSGADQ